MKKIFLFGVKSPESAAIAAVFSIYAAHLGQRAALLAVRGEPKPQASRRGNAWVVHSTAWGCFGAIPGRLRGDCLRALTLVSAGDLEGVLRATLRASYEAWAADVERRRARKEAAPQ